MRFFFSFAYTEDHLRAKMIMEQYLVHPNTSATGFIEDVEIDRMCEEGLVRVYQWIERAFSKADAFVVLIEHNSNYSKQRYKEQYIMRIPKILFTI